MTTAFLAAALLAAPRVLTLREALESARSNQPQLRQARAQTEAASARARESLSPMLPQLSATAGYQRTTANTIPRPGAPVTQTVGGVAGPSRSWTTYNSLSDTVTASQLLFDFGASPNRYQASKAAADAQAAQERATALQVDFTVRQTFFDARANRSLVDVAREALANQQAHLRQTQGFVQAGTRPEIDLVQARTDTANAQVQLINAENAYETSKVALNAAMGAPGPTDYDVGNEAMQEIAGEDVGSEPLLQEALKTRPEVQSIEDLVRADELTVRALQGNYWPTISAGAGLTQGGQRLTDLGWNVQVGVNLSWNIFQGGLTRAQVSEATANLVSEIAQLDLLKQQLRSDVDAARLAVRAAKASLSATSEALVNARERLRLAQQRYAVGVGSAIELGDAQVALTQAAAQAVQSDDRLATARAQLLRALGRR